MFSKVDELTNPGEEVIDSIHPSHFDTRHITGTIIIPAALTVLITAAVIGSALNFVPFGSPAVFAAFYLLPIAILAFYDLRRRFVIYHFTDNQVIEETGVFNKNINTMHYQKITHTTLDQDIEERIFSVSDIHIDSAGEGNTEIVLNGVKDAGKYKNLIDERAFNNSQQQQNQFNNNQNSNFNNQNQNGNFNNRNNQGGGQNNFGNNGSSQQF